MPPRRLRVYHSRTRRHHQQRCRHGPRFRPLTLRHLVSFEQMYKWQTHATTPNEGQCYHCSQVLQAASHDHLNWMEFCKRPLTSNGKLEERLNGGTRKALNLPSNRPIDWQLSAHLRHQGRNTPVQLAHSKTTQQCSQVNLHCYTGQEFQQEQHQRCRLCFHRRPRPIKECLGEAL